MKYAKNINIVDVVSIKDEEVIALDDNGGEINLTKEYLNAFYTPVVTIENGQEWTLESIAAGYEEMGKLISEENEEDYIFEVESK